MSKKMNINLTKNIYIDLVFISYLLLVTDLPNEYININRLYLSFDQNNKVIKNDSYFKFLINKNF